MSKRDIDVLGYQSMTAKHKQRKQSRFAKGSVHTKSVKSKRLQSDSEIVQFEVTGRSGVVEEDEQSSQTESSAQDIQLEAQADLPPLQHIDEDAYQTEKSPEKVFLDTTEKLILHQKEPDIEESKQLAK